LGLLSIDCISGNGNYRSCPAGSLLPHRNTSPHIRLLPHSAFWEFTMQAIPAAEEGKMLGDALNTVKIQVQQMKRHLVCCHYLCGP
jgi:hypothetical protein